VSRDRPNGLNRKASASEKVEGTTLADTNREVGIVVDNSDAGDQTHPKRRKRRMSDKENGDTWTSKRTKVSVPMRMIDSLTVHIFVQKGMDFRIKIHAGKKRSTVKISVKIT